MRNNYFILFQIMRPFNNIVLTLKKFEKIGVNMWRPY